MNTLATPELDVVDQIGATLDRLYSTGIAYTDSRGPIEVGQTALPRGEGLALETLARAIGARQTVETGFAFGASGLSLVRGMLSQPGIENGPEPIHVAFDPYEARLWDNAGLNMFKEAGASKYLRFHQRGSEYGLADLAESGMASFDLGFVDGNHRFDGAFMDLNYMARVVKPGGIILVDDGWLPAVQSVVNFFITNKILDAAPDIRQLAPIRPNTAALRVPMTPHDRPWDEFIPFGHKAEAGGAW